MLKGLKTASGVRFYDRVLPASRKFVKEQVALAHVTANEAAVLVNELYAQLAEQGVDVKRPDDIAVFETAVKGCLTDKELVREAKRNRHQELADKLAKEKADAFAKPYSVTSKPTEEPKEEKAAVTVSAS